MYPVVIGNGRCMTNDTVIKGYHIPKGVSVQKIVYQFCKKINEKFFFLFQYLGSSSISTLRNK